MIRILIFLALIAALIATLIVMFTPHLLLLAFVLAILSFPLRWAWGVAGDIVASMSGKKGAP